MEGTILITVFESCLVVAMGVVPDLSLHLEQLHVGHFWNLRRVDLSFLSLCCIAVSVLGGSIAFYAPDIVLPGELMYKLCSVAPTHTFSFKNISLCLRDCIGLHWHRITVSVLRGTNVCHASEYCFGGSHR